MKPALLYTCSFADKSADPDLLAELVSALEYDFSSRLDAESGVTLFTLYFDSEAGARNAAERLEKLRPDWNGLGAVFGNIEAGTVRREDWAESWKLHFKPIEISNRLAVTPSWTRPPEIPGRKVMVLDPGMSFGTGRHATTRFCLTMLDRYAAEHDVSASSFLDAGCGTGILAIAAVLLGWKDVSAFDIDPDAVSVARENAKVNHAESIHFETAPLVEFRTGKQFDVAAANILSSALLAGKAKLASLVKPGGTLILAGILDREYPAVRDAFVSEGFEEYETLAEEDWRSGAFRYNKRSS